MGKALIGKRVRPSFDGIDANRKMTFLDYEGEVKHSKTQKDKHTVSDGLVESCSATTQTNMNAAPISLDEQFSRGSDVNPQEMLDIVTMDFAGHR